VKAIKIEHTNRLVAGIEQAVVTGHTMKQHLCS